MVKPEQWQTDDGETEGTPGKGQVLCYVKNGTVPFPSIGSRVFITGRFSLYGEATNEGQFDARGYYAAQRIYGRITKASCTERNGPDLTGRGKERLWQLRRHLSETLLDTYGEENGALLAAMLLGERIFLPEETKSLYKAAGALHIIAISGLHIGLLGMGLYRLLLKILGGRAFAAVGSSIFMALYVAMTGASPSAVRAFLMFGLSLLAGYWKRTFDTLTALSVSAVVILLGNPAYLWQSSFLLSFLAILSLAVFRPAVAACVPSVTFLETMVPKPIGKLLKKAGKSLLGSLSVWLVTLPVQLFFFSEVSLFGIFFNLLVIPLMGAVLLLGVGSLLAAEARNLFAGLPVKLPADLGGGLAEVCRQTETFLLSVITGGGRLAAKLPETVWTPGKPSYLRMFFAFGVLLLFCFVGNMSEKENEIRGKRYRLGLLLGVILLLLKSPPKSLRITFLDVGQGDGICMELPDGTVYLVDGGSSNVNKVGNYRLLPFLKTRGIRRIDTVFLTHGDTDHTNGITELLAEPQITIERLYLPERGTGTEKNAETNKGEFAEILSLAEERNIPVETGRAGDRERRGELSFVCLNPDTEAKLTAESSNASSLVLYVEYRKFSMLLTGDLEGDGEKKVAGLLKENAVSGVSLLKVAHHGSKNSTKESFLGQCRPAVAVISCGKNNSYGHPHEETLKRFKETGTVVLRTDVGGAIQVEVTGRRMRVTAYRGR